MAESGGVSITSLGSVTGCPLSGCYRGRSGVVSSVLSDPATEVWRGGLPTGWMLHPGGVPNPSAAATDVPLVAGCCRRTSINSKLFAPDFYSQWLIDGMNKARPAWIATV